MVSLTAPANSSENASTNAIQVIAHAVNFCGVNEMRMGLR